MATSEPVQPVQYWCVYQDTQHYIFVRGQEPAVGADGAVRFHDAAGNLLGLIAAGTWLAILPAPSKPGED